MAYVSKLVDLETKLNNSYFNYLKEDNASNRDNLFMDIRNLALEIACINKYNLKYNMDLDEIGNEYALRLFERIVLQGFRLVTDSGRVPFTAYIRVNILDVIISDNRAYLKLKEELIELQNHSTTTHNIQPDRFSRAHVTNQIYKGLQLFYSEIEIKRYLNLALDVIFRNKNQPIPHEKLPSSLRDFTVVLICMAKRIASDSEVSVVDDISDFKKAMEASVNSSVFIAAVTNAEAFPKELLLSIDLAGLYRLCTVSGGKKIKIPTLRQLDSIVGAVSSVSQYILEGKPYAETLKKSKTNLDLVFSSKTNMHHFISKAIKTLELDDWEVSQEPLIKALSTSKKAIEAYVDEINSKTKAYKYRSELLKTIKDYKKFLDRLEAKLEKLPQ